ncbi:MAG: hypothetical protein NVS2B16_26150 [Chloroflexota bacterium]
MDLACLPEPKGLSVGRIEQKRFKKWERMEPNIVSLSTRETVPNFQLLDEAGNLWRLSEELRGGSVVIVLYRGDW